MPPDPNRPAAADRALGARLAQRLRGVSTAGPSQLRGLLPSLLGEPHPLQAPLHDLVARPGFRRLLAASGEPGRRAEQAQLLQELAETYSPGVTARLGQVLDGLLESRGGGAAAPAPPEVPAATPVVTTAPFRPPAPRWPARSAGGPATTARPAGGRRSSRRRLPGLIALTAAVTLASGLLLGLVRSNRLCPSLGLCFGAGSPSTASIDASLQQADEAAAALESATDIDAFTAALGRLDTALLPLVSQRLSPRQEQRRQRLQERADDAHRRLRQEQRALRSLEEAAALIGDLERATPAGPPRFDALAEARARLDAVPAESFSRAGVEALERRLAAIQDRPLPPSGEPSAPTATPPASPSVEKPPAAPVLPPPGGSSRPPAGPVAAPPAAAPPTAAPPPLTAPPPVRAPVLPPPPVQPPPAP